MDSFLDLGLTGAAVALRRRLYLAGGSLGVHERIVCEVLMAGKKEIVMAEK